MTTRERTVVETALDRPAPGGTMPTSAGTRLAWADVAKGGCILLVLLWHVIVKDYLQIDWRLDVPVPGAWGTLGELLLPMRMPLFFTISGLFAASAVQRPWRSVARPRVARFLYLYGAWLMIHTAVLALAPDFPTDRANDLGALVAQLTVTPSNLWYLYALALYFVLAKALRRVRPAVLLAAAGTLSAVASAGLVDTPGNRAGLYQNLVFFLAGLHLRGYVLRWADAVTGRRALLAAGAYAVGLARPRGAARHRRGGPAGPEAGGRRAARRPRPPDLTDLRTPHAGAGAAASTDRRADRRPGRARSIRVGPRLPTVGHRRRAGAQPRTAPAAAGDPGDVAVRPARPTTDAATTRAAGDGTTWAERVGTVRVRAGGTARADGVSMIDFEGEDMSHTDPPRAVPAPIDVPQAARWLAGRVVRTPVLSAPAIDRLAGARVLLKAENLQVGGSYKMRGGLFAVGRLAAAGHKGVVAQSTGNHAVAVALAARTFALAATVVLPVDAAATTSTRTTIRTSSPGRAVPASNWTPSCCRSAAVAARPCLSGRDRPTDRGVRGRAPWLRLTRP
ncbi:pyridoxal-phosphate dependent enzyme [Verrucosispora sioxanthis]|uniref:pyridoxal-phosphate dependent enzyme n=1 Tax=Verrucosispora sioxanthis TaxID=2499994 RepID=UPI00209FD75D|nr:pyridoxal-phosphate dependent enzyme [Verrucosispora sioxanthis]